VLIDPVCPVISFGPPAPNATQEMRVMYFPSSKDAKLKDPQSLVLSVGFNHPGRVNSAVIPFVRKDDHWEAVVNLLERHPFYLIFAVKDDKTNTVDDNDGQFWDVVFCDPSGPKDINGVLAQADGYAGNGWGVNIVRTKDYAKAVSIIETAIAQDDKARKYGMGLRELWNYKAQLYGGDAQGWAKLADELGKFMADHQDEPGKLGAVGEFVVRYQDKLSAEFVDSAVTALDVKNPKHNYRADLAYISAIRERDPQKRLAALDDFLARYPDSGQVTGAHESRLYAFIQLGNVAGAEAAFAKWQEGLKREKDNFCNPSADDGYLSLARLYLDKGVKLQESLKLIDEASAALTPNPALPDCTIPPEFQRAERAYMDHLRARAYLGLHKPTLALTSAQKAIEVSKGPETYFVLAQAYAATGNKQEALDAYFEAALLPSNNDLEYRSELERFYQKQHFGNHVQFQAAFEERKAARFRAIDYVPTLLDRPAPKLEFVTLKGEKFDAAALGSKIVNFWSPS